MSDKSLTTEQVAGLIAGVIGAILLPGVLALFIFWDGLVLRTLWGWYVVPLFHLPFLSLPNAIGLACLVCFLTNQYQYRPKEMQKWDKFWGFFNPFITGAIFLAVGRLLRP